MRERKAYQKENKIKKPAAVEYTATYKAQRSDELLAFLLKKCNTSRNNVKHLLTCRQVLVNGSVVTQHNFPLAKDDEIKIAKHPVKEGQALAANAAKATKKSVGHIRRSALPTIVYEDEDFIVINKPEGLLSVESDTESECAYAQVFAYLASKDKNARPYILHRIDKETSGVLVFAKNIKLHSMLKMNWNEHVVQREYYAVVEGQLPKSEDTLVCYLKENKNNLMYATQDVTGQKAVTSYQVLAQNEKYSLVRVEIQTGRKNQIRVQMQAIGNPVVGDDKYGATQNPLKRLGLHASQLQFIHPVTKELLAFRCPPPAAFRALFK